MAGLDSPLTPLRFLQRAAATHPEKVGIVDGPRQLTWQESAQHATRLARALQASGVESGDRVVYLASNSAELVIAHFAVPLAEAVLVATNTRLAPDEVGYILGHCDARLVMVDSDVAEPHKEVLAQHGAEVVALPAQDGTPGPLVGATPYAQLLARGSDEPLPWTVRDETSTIAINYTSGTTGNPKGVMYTHRGAYLNSLGQCLHQEFTTSTRYLWTLPMFHCNGWCTAWAVTAVSGTHVCLRAVRGALLWELLDREQITHLAGAPTVLTIMAEADVAHSLDPAVSVVTAGAPPNPTVIEKFQHLNARIIHVYGLTETYGPYSVCEWQPGWDDLPPGDLAGELSRQGVGMVTALDLRVVETNRKDGALVDVPCDGVTMGEIVMSGNTVMKGYYRDREATEEAFRGGWFRSGDLGVRHPNGYVQLLDRAKDVVISGGENISSIEVEQALMKHPAVRDAAVIGVPHEKWGERPKAFVVLIAPDAVSAAELIAHVKERLAKFKAPDSIEFVPDLPRTVTGKVRKNVLKDAERAAVGGAR